MPPLLYQNFDLLLERNGERYRAHVTTSPAGEADDFFDLTELSLADPQQSGEQLFQTLFSNSVGQCLALSWQSVQQAGMGLRIRLRLDEDAPELAQLPWELLYSPDWGRFLALSSQTPLLRYLLQLRADPPLLVQPPLRLLVVIAAPGDQVELNSEQEWSLLQRALADLVHQGLLVLERLTPATPTALQDRLRKGDVHLLHFVGHGDFDEASQEGRLYFENESQQSVPISASQLAILLGDAAPRLVFLNACQGATSGSQHLFAGVAQKLVTQRIPAVIAMQAPITDVAATLLAHTFYKALADDYPVDAALGEARKAIFTSGAYPELAEWATPILFSRSPDNQIFHLAPTVPLLPGQPFEPETILIPAGAFWMGSDDGSVSERPRHQVTLPAYRIGKYPVTNAEYLAHVRDQSVAVAPELGWVLATVGQEPAPGQEDHPVVGVSWDDAVRYCNWLSEKTKRTYRLPSEAEWEKAAGGEEGRRYPWGNDFDPKCCNSIVANFGTTTTVYTYVSQGNSPYGCADMAGNVWEWTNTIWGAERSVARYPYPYVASDGREKLDRSGPFRELRICRGGCYQDKAERLTRATRARQPADGRDVRRGFRVLREE